MSETKWAEFGKHITENTVGSRLKLLPVMMGGDNSVSTGAFSTLSVADLRGSIEPPKKTGQLKFTHIGVPDVLNMHASNPGAVFQVASQFNCLEMLGQWVTPNHGIQGYIDDPTQGPTCAMACPTATIYRNYMVRVHRPRADGHQGDPLPFLGQRKADGANYNQINNLSRVDAMINGGEYYTHSNGYTIFKDVSSAHKLEQVLKDRGDVTDIIDAIRVGVHRDVPVLYTNRIAGTVTPIRADTAPEVTQVFASAFPVSYNSNHSPIFSQCCLHAAYEATLLEAVHQLQTKNKGRQTVFLTQIGGGAYGNPPNMILEAIRRAVLKVKDYPLDVVLVHYITVNTEVQKILTFDPDPPKIEFHKIDTSQHEYDYNGDEKVGVYGVVPDYLYNKGVHGVVPFYLHKNGGLNKKYHSGFLGNFWDLDEPLYFAARCNYDKSKYDGPKIAFHNSEAAFQALKYWGVMAPNKKPAQEEFAKETGSGAFKFSQNMKKMITPGKPDYSYGGWGRYDAMYNILKAKFGVLPNPHTRAGDLLKRTGAAFLLEYAEKDLGDNGDEYWNNGRKKKIMGFGYNMLGHALMQVRCDLMKDNSEHDKLQKRLNEVKDYAEKNGGINSDKWMYDPWQKDVYYYTRVVKNDFEGSDPTVVTQKK